MATKKVKLVIKPPQLGASSVVSLPQPSVRNAEEFLKAYVGYIYTAVGAIAQEVASIDLHLYRIKYGKGGKPKTQEIFEHEALSMLHYVNDISTLYDLSEATQVYLELTGESFWVVLKDGKVPTEIWPLRPDWVKVIPHPTKVISHYNYYAGGVMSDKVEIPRENMIPFKYFNPLNPYRGKGATQAAALPFDILNFAQEYNRNFFFNSAIPSMIFTSENKIGEGAIKKFLAQWMSSFGGRGKSNKIAFLGNGMKMDKASFGSKELDFTEQMKQMRDDVLAVFKVPKTILGLTDDVNRANADATTRAFMERVVTPRMRKLVDSLNEFFIPMFGEDDLFLDFTDPAPEDVELKLKKYANARQYTWMTPNEIRAEENLEPIEGGDELFANPTGGGNQDPNAEDPNNDTTGGDNNSDNTEDTTKPTAEEGKGLRPALIKLLGGEVKKKVYVPKVLPKPVKHMVRIPAKKPKKLAQEKMAAKFVEPLKKFIGELVSTDEYSPLLKSKKKATTDKEKEQERLAKEITEKVKKLVEPNKDGSGWDEDKKVNHWNNFIKKVSEREKSIEDVAREVFDEQEKIVIANLENSDKGLKAVFLKKKPSSVIPSLADLDKMWDALVDVLKDIYIEEGNTVLDELGSDQDINITTDFAVQYLSEYSGVLISGINETTREKLRIALSEGYDAGEGVGQLAGRVHEVFDEADKNRALLIAQTESLKASNAATVEAYRQSEVVEYKEWLSERDNKTCPFCLKQDGKFISLNKNFFNQGDTISAGGETMTVSFTDVGEPPLHGRCRCTVIPVLKTES